MRVQRGTQRLLCNVPFREHHLVRQHVAVPWKQGVCPRTATSCFLMTDLGYPVQKLTALYGRRMTIEERFRDKKNRRHGSRVAEHPDQAAGRFDRLLLILTLASWLPLGIGLEAQSRCAPGMWCSTNRPKGCGVFFIGRKMLRRLELTVV